MKEKIWRRSEGRRSAVLTALSNRPSSEGVSMRGRLTESSKGGSRKGFVGVSGDKVSLK